MWYNMYNDVRCIRWYNVVSIVILMLGKGAKKKIEKNLTSVSFAFTHTYTAVKTNSFRFFPQAYMENFEKCAKTGNMGTLGGGWGC